MRIGAAVGLLLFGALLCAVAFVNRFNVDTQPGWLLVAIAALGICSIAVGVRALARRNR